MLSEDERKKMGDIVIAGGYSLYLLRISLVASETI
jgi:hypothetical protein